MFGGRIHCEANGVHRVTTDRLEVVSGRRSDEEQYNALCAEPEIEHWLGWGSRGGPITRAARQPYAEPLEQPQQTRPASLESTLFVAIHRANNMLIGGVGLDSEPDGSSNVGGAIRGGFRNQGYGREIMAAVVDVLHQHFGLTELRAGCEVANLASRRWLTTAGFERADGPATHTLANGRVIDSLWWVRRDPTARRRCDHLYETLDLAFAAMQPAETLPPEARSPSGAATLS